MDVNIDRSVYEAIEKITTEFGKIDILVNNAGYGLFGDFEDFTMVEIKNQFETNVFGVIRVIREVLPIMRQQKAGIIINISSISGLAGVPTQSAYCATKFAVEGGMAGWSKLYDVAEVNLDSNITLKIWQVRRISKGVHKLCCCIHKR